MDERQHPARVTLSWVQRRPGVTSPIIGARRLDQLEDNLAAPDLVLPDEVSSTLDAAIAPSLPIPPPVPQGDARLLRQRDDHQWPHDGSAVDVSRGG